MADVQTNINMESITKIIQISSDMANLMRISSKKQDPSSLFNGMKSIINDSLEVLVDIQGIEGAESALKQAEALSQMLKVNNLSGKDIKTTYKAMGDFASTMTSILGEVASENIPGLPDNAQDMAKSAFETFKIAKNGFEKFADLYQGFIKPGLKEAGINIDLKSEATELASDLFALISGNKKHNNGPSKNKAVNKDLKPSWQNKIGDMNNKLDLLHQKHGAAPQEHAHAGAGQSHAGVKPHHPIKAHLVNDDTSGELVTSFASILD